MTIPLTIQNLIKVFKEHTGVGFISFPYENAKGEVAKVLVNIGISYENAKKRDLETLKAGIEYIPNDKYNKADWDMAIQEKIDSLEGKPRLKKDGTPVKQRVDNNLPLDIVKDEITTTNKMSKFVWNIETQTAYIRGSLVSKTIIEQGEYKEVNSAGKTIAKQVIDKYYLSTGKIRNYKIGMLQGSLKINGDILTAE